MIGTLPPPPPPKEQIWIRGWKKNDTFFIDRKEEKKKGRKEGKKGGRRGRKGAKKELSVLLGRKKWFKMTHFSLTE